MFHFARVGNEYDPIVPQYIADTDEDRLEFYLLLEKFYIEIGIRALLTSDEWQHMIDGEDIVLTGPEFDRRMAKLRNKK